MRILIVDDDPIWRNKLKTSVIELMGKEIKEDDIKTIDNGKDALSMIEYRRGGNEQFDMVFLDYMLPGQDGLEILKEIQLLDADIPVIMISGQADIEQAVQFRLAGAKNYIDKAAYDKSLAFVMADVRKYIDEHVLPKVAHAQDIVKLDVYVKKLSDGSYEIDVSQSKNNAMREALRLAQKAAEEDVPALLIGETGTGKEVLAKAIHKCSIRQGKTFVPIECSTIPETLMESELFGHEKGAFTGATSRRLGQIELAKNGTLFLDEVDDMPLDVQKKLRRALQEREITRVGGTAPIPVDFHLIAATKRNPEDLVAEGLLREDLYHRINVLPIHIPPLRERKEDIEGLTKYFIRKFNKEQKRNISRISSDAMELLQNHSWPGNVRELEHTILRGIINAPKGAKVLQVNHIQISRESQTVTKVNSAGAKKQKPEERIDELENQLSMLKSEIIEEYEEEMDALRHRVLMLEKGIVKKQGDILDELFELIEPHLRMGEQLPLDDFNDRAVLMAYDVSRDNKTQAAKLLKLTRSRFDYAHSQLSKKE